MMPDSVAFILFHFSESIAANHSFYTLSTAHLQSHCIGLHFNPKFRSTYEDVKL
jgi:hypothetical protein